ncbi:carbohydrate ABC transporter permease [Ruania alba]|uniref:Carbohydrate ABC transporter membrane protein 1, CUT1 family n=1 Tax=Ruania alba TaxID=648782 RepID=A0A1H5H093_9MICO|nr:sugar ABC transporter permease [Ruania alba]SEE21184.1 carbohydrate ABC transporter membrane protein 1, CUT1 family [Ruania alba]
MVRTATAEAPARQRPDRLGTRKALAPASPALYLLPAVLVAAALSVYPLVEMVRMALSSVGPTDLISQWEFLGLENFRNVLGDPLFWESVRATALLTVGLIFSNLVVGYLGAMVLARRGRLASGVLALMVFVWALPPLVSGSVWKFMLSGDGVANAALGLVGLGPVNWLSSPQVALGSVTMVTAWAALPFAILVIRGGLLGISPEVLEAAAIDGAGPVRTTVSVIVPLLRPTFGVLLILTILHSFRSFDFVFVMTSGGPGTVTNTLPFFAYTTAFTTYDFGVGSAIAALAMLIIAVLAIPYILSVRREEQQ